ncbi:hypothetical protein ACOSQ4_008622 [Xanthoceras sorbifolium]
MRGCQPSSPSLSLSLSVIICLLVLLMFGFHYLNLYTICFIRLSLHVCFLVFDKEAIENYLMSNSFCTFCSFYVQYILLYF